MSYVTEHSVDSSRYARCIAVSKRIRWDTDRDVIRGRQFDTLVVSPSCPL